MGGFRDTCFPPITPQVELAFPNLDVDRDLVASRKPGDKYIIVVTASLNAVQCIMDGPRFLESGPHSTEIAERFVNLRLAGHVSLLGNTCR